MELDTKFLQLPLTRNSKIQPGRDPDQRWNRMFC